MKKTKKRKTKNKKKLKLKLKFGKKEIALALGAMVALGLSVLLLWKFGEGFRLQTSIVSNGYPIVSDGRMEQMKRTGCVYDGLLTPRYNRYFDASVEMLGRSECQYIHRAIETWNIPPDFNEIEQRMNVIKERTGKEFIYGMFIAESIDLNKGYYDPIGGRYFRFSAMCAPGTHGAWGGNTCKPSFEREEYRKYLFYITRKAIDLGIEDFTFGQIYYQDPNWEKSHWAKEIVSQMKAYAASKGKEISVGAQTNIIDKESYLRRFDYVTGGVGQHKDGWIENEDPCWSVYYERSGYCWAMLWHEKYKSKTNNILVYLDWNNSHSDDIHRFVSMDQEKRKRFLGKAYDFFLWRDIGFLFPLGEVLGHIGGGTCRGPTSEFYSASNDYSCKDEGSINDVLLGKWPLPNYSKFVSQKVPEEMEAGKTYEVKIKLENTSFRKWTKENRFKLGSWNPQDNFSWGTDRVEFENGESTKHGEKKEFRFKVTAPKELGDYSFQWKMLLEDIEWFGETSENLTIKVIPAKKENTQIFPANLFDLNTFR